MTEIGLGSGKNEKNLILSSEDGNEIPKKDMCTNQTCTHKLILCEPAFFFPTHVHVKLRPHAIVFVHISS